MGEDKTERAAEWLQIPREPQSPDLITAEQEIDKNTSTPAALASQVRQLLGSIICLLILLLLRALLRMHLVGL